MQQIHWHGVMLYVYGTPVPGYGWNVWYGKNSGAFIGMDCYGDAISFQRWDKPYGIE